MSLYSEYLEAKYTARRVIEIDNGFIEYEMYPDKTCYIWSFYVRPDKRHAGLGTQLEEMLIKKERPVSISCQVELDSINPELSLRKILTQPYKITFANEKSIVLLKEIQYAKI